MPAWSGDLEQGRKVVRGMARRITAFAILCSALDTSSQATCTCNHRSRRRAKEDEGTISDHFHYTHKNYKRVTSGKARSGRQLFGMTQGGTACMCAPPLPPAPPAPPPPPPPPPPPLPPGWACSATAFPAPHYIRATNADGDILATPIGTAANYPNYPDVVIVNPPAGFQQNNVATISFLAKSAASSPLIFGCAGYGGFLRIVIAPNNTWTRLTATDTFKHTHCIFEHRTVGSECSSVAWSASANPTGATTCADFSDGEVAIRGIEFVAGGPQCLSAATGVTGGG